MLRRSHRLGERIARLSLSGKTALVVLALIVVGGLVALVYTPYSPYAIRPYERWLPPSLLHICGTDGLGRDLFSRLAAGSARTVLTSVTAVFIAITLGVLLAALIATSHRHVSGVLQRAADLFIAFPTLLIAMLLATAFVGSSATVAAAIGLGSVSVVTRTVLPELYASVRSEHALLAQQSGASWWWIVTRHVAPDIMPTLTVRATQLLGTAILAESGLSYLGLGPQPPAPSWGRMLAEFQPEIGVHTWPLAITAAVLLATVISFAIVGDALRDVFDVRLEDHS
ncbi:MAG: ABC transporter permease [Actinomycetaceae bacterium]|nr:ABC transporter permease [Actinomycetaceae bacterium]MDY6082895.1 ABC transporter permease [Actinomycetaceae bacterium]